MTPLNRHLAAAITAIWFLFAGFPASADAAISGECVSLTNAMTVASGLSAGAPLPGNTDLYIKYFRYIISEKNVFTPEEVRQILNLPEAVDPTEYADQKRQVELFGHHKVFATILEEPIDWSRVRGEVGADLGGIGEKEKSREKTRVATAEIVRPEVVKSRPYRFNGDPLAFEIKGKNYVIVPTDFADSFSIFEVPSGKKVGGVDLDGDIEGLVLFTEGAELRGSATNRQGHFVVFELPQGKVVRQLDVLKKEDGGISWKPVGFYDNGDPRIIFGTNEKFGLYDPVNNKVLYEKEVPDTIWHVVLTEKKGVALGLVNFGKTIRSFDPYTGKWGKQIKMPKDDSFKEAVPAVFKGKPYVINAMTEYKWEGGYNPTPHNYLDVYDPVAPKKLFRINLEQQSRSAETFVHDGRLYAAVGGMTGISVVDVFAKKSTFIELGESPQTNSDGYSSVKYWEFAGNGYLLVPGHSKDLFVLSVPDYRVVSKTARAAINDHSPAVISDNAGSFWAVGDNGNKMTIIKLTNPAR